MRKTLLISAIVALLVLPLLLVEQPQARPVPPQQPPQEPRTQAPQMGVEVRLVNVIFSVLTRRNKLIKDMNQENFRVFEDDKPQDIKFFSRETNLPLRIGLLLDTSNSIRDRLGFEQEAAIDFLHNVVRRHKDLAFLMTFDNEPQLIHEFSEDVGALSETIRKQRAGGGTALFDTIYVAARDHFTKAPLPAGEDPSVRRILVVISDGEDNLSDQHTREEAIEMAQRADVVVYCISTGSQTSSVPPTSENKERTDRSEGDRVLRRIAEETGGRAFFPYRTEDLSFSFEGISDELRSQYSLAYTPSNRAPDGKFRKIRIETDRRGLVVRARKGYFAPRPQPAKPAGN